MAWDATIPTNRQQLMRRFAERTQVAVIEAPLPVLGSVAGRSRGRIRRHGWRRDGNVRVLQAWDWVPYPLAKRSHSISLAADSAFRRFVRGAWNKLGWPAPVLWLYPWDSADLLGCFGERLSLYHCVDDYRANERYVGYRRVARYAPSKREEVLVGAVDLVVVTAPRLFDRWSGRNAHTYLLPNVADTALFARGLLPGDEHSALTSIPRPRVGYVGALDAYKVDFALLGALAARCPDVQFVCVGSVGISDRTHPGALPRANNIHYLGILPQADLPAVLRGCAASLIPYVQNDYTAGVSPLKLYEYLAAGQPVVATPLPALVAQQPHGLVLAEPDPATFAAALRAAMAIGQEERVGIAEDARAHNWERRVDELERLILAHLGRTSQAAAMGTLLEAPARSIGSDGSG
jgi:glycosyltransferase involved in cell wall biosynthesis